MAYPTSISTFTNPSGTSLLASGPDHAALHTSINNDLTAVETKLGTGAGSAATNQILVGSGAGVSAWGSVWTSGSIVNPNITNAFLGTFAAKGLYNCGTVSGLGTVNWNNGDRQVYTLSANGTVAFSNAGVGQIITLEILQNSTGGYSLVFPSMIWPYGASGIIGTAANSINVLTVFYDFTGAYLAQLGPSFA